MKLQSRHFTQEMSSTFAIADNAIKVVHLDGNKLYFCTPDSHIGSVLARSCLKVT